MSPTFISHHGQNIAGNALCTERGATTLFSSVIVSSCASHRVALRGDTSPVVEVLSFPPSCRIICLSFSFHFFPFFSLQNIECSKSTFVATQDRVFPHYVPNSSIKHSKSDSKDRSQEIL
jgi:hypothetical protein